MKNISQKFSKKANSGTDSAVIQLFYIILGVFVLLTFIKVIFTFLNLDAHTNSDITTSNGESIHNFQKYSNSDKFKNLDSCYTTLKLTNLETYQFEEDDIAKNNMIVINKDAIYYLKLSRKDEFYESPSTNLLKKIKDFDSDVKLAIDNTDQGVGFTIDLTFTTIGNFDSQLKLSENIDYIVLEPIFGKNFAISYDNLVNENTEIIDNRNKYLIKTIYQNEIKTIESETLVFNPNTKQLFVTNGKISDSMINNELCSYKNFRNLITSQEFTKDNGKDIPIAYYDVHFKITTGGIDSGYKFNWGNQISCEKDSQTIDCYQTLDIDKYLELDYNTFIKKIKTFSETKIETAGNHNLKISYTKLSDEEIKNRQLTNPPQIPTFNQVFKTPSPKLDLLEMEKEDTKEENNIFELNDRINGCDDDDCEDFYFITKTNKNTPVFYIQGNSDNREYMYFNTNYLVQNKKENKLYFNGKLITNIETFSADKYGISFFGGDNVETYILHDIELYDESNTLKKYTIIISSTQRNFITEVQ
jgi:hypothetical protein